MGHLQSPEVFRCRNFFPSFLFRRLPLCLLLGLQAAQLVAVQFAPRPRPRTSTKKTENHKVCHKQRTIVMYNSRSVIAHAAEFDSAPAPKSGASLGAAKRNIERYITSPVSSLPKKKKALSKKKYVYSYTRTAREDWILFERCTTLVQAQSHGFYGQPVPRWVDEHETLLGTRMKLVTTETRPLSDEMSQQFVHSKVLSRGRNGC